MAATEKIQDISCTVEPIVAFVDCKSPAHGSNWSSTRPLYPPPPSIYLCSFLFLLIFLSLLFGLLFVYCYSSMLKRERERDLEMCLSRLTLYCPRLCLVFSCLFVLQLFDFELLCYYAILICAYCEIQVFQFRFKWVFGATSFFFIVVYQLDEIRHRWLPNANRFCHICNSVRHLSAVPSNKLQMNLLLIIYCNLRQERTPRWSIHP